MCTRSCSWRARPKRGAPGRASTSHEAGTAAWRLSGSPGACFSVLCGREWMTMPGYFQALILVRTQHAPRHAAPHSLAALHSVGKSSLLSTLTETESEAAAYEFTTLTCIPGNIIYNDTKIQLLDLPGTDGRTGRGWMAWMDGLDGDDGADDWPNAYRKSKKGRSPSHSIFTHALALDARRYHRGRRAREGPRAGGDRRGALCGPGADGAGRGQGAGEQPPGHPRAVRGGVFWGGEEG